MLLQEAAICVERQAKGPLQQHRRVWGLCAPQATGACHTRVRWSPHRTACVYLAARLHMPLHELRFGLLLACLARCCVLLYVDQHSLHS